jgi:hypothetical protein
MYKCQMKAELIGSGLKAFQENVRSQLAILFR